MARNKQIRVYVDPDYWAELKENGESDTDTFNRLLKRLDENERIVAELERVHTDTSIPVAMLPTIFSELRQVHPNPLVAIGMLLSRQVAPKPVAPSVEPASQPAVLNNSSSPAVTEEVPEFDPEFDELTQDLEAFE